MSSCKKESTCTCVTKMNDSTKNERITIKDRTKKECNDLSGTIIGSDSEGNVIGEVGTINCSIK